MWSSIENLKQNLNQIALDVHSNDDDEDYGIDRRNGYGSPVSPSSVSSSSRRVTNRFANSSSSLSVLQNGNDSPLDSEVEQYKNEIRRLKDSEFELKALSKNYSALMKEKEDQISKLSQENRILMDKIKPARESMIASSSENILKGSEPQSAGRNTRFGNNSPKTTSKEVADSNGITHISTPQILEKELADLKAEKDNVISEMQSSYVQQLQKLKLELKKEHDKSTTLLSKLQGEQQISNSLREELKMSSEEMSIMRSEMNKKHTETELGRRNDDESINTLKRVMSVLQTENSKLQSANNDLKATLENTRTSTSPHPEELNTKVQTLEKALKHESQERDKTLQELKRLKQHLLEKESEEAEKMDEDSKTIEDLRRMNDTLNSRVSQLENSLSQTTASREEALDTIKNSKKVINELRAQIADCHVTIESKNMELLNLQTALGQYYAEVESKEHLERQLAAMKDESSKFVALLKKAEEEKEALKREKDEASLKVWRLEQTMGEGKNRMAKLEDDNSKLRRALEHGMNRLNRMSADSDFLVDRRIVIKLLVTYFQKNHSKEVLELMVRMLGFSDEDKQRIGIARRGGARGVLSGIFAGASPASSAPDDASHSFADLWVDFLLKEKELEN